MKTLLAWLACAWWSIAAGTVTFEWSANPLLLKCRDMEMVAGYYVYWEEVSGGPTEGAVTNKENVGRVTTWRTSQFVPGRKYLVRVAVYAVAAPEWEIGSVTVTMPEAPQELTRLVKITLESSRDLKKWEPIAIVFRIPLPADLAFVRARIEEVEP